LCFCPFLSVLSLCVTLSLSTCLPLTSFILTPGTHTWTWSSGLYRAIPWPRWPGRRVFCPVQGSEHRDSHAEAWAAVRSEWVVAGIWQVDSEVVEKGRDVTQPWVSLGGGEHGRTRSHVCELVLWGSGPLGSQTLGPPR
jgi:hypothetical protein